MKLHLRKIIVLLVLSSAMIGSVLVRADIALLPLGELIDRSDRILIGAVTKVTEGATAGEQIALLNVEEVLSGAGLKELRLRGSSTDPDLPKFHEGSRVLVFLQPSRQSDIFNAVHGEHGVMAIPEKSVNATRDIIKEALSKGSKLRLRDVQDSFRRGGLMLPPVLVGSLLEELSLRTTSEDAALVKEIACNTKGSFHAVPQVWAISRVGALKMSNARSCLEGVVNEKQDRAKVVAAIEALGELGDSNSVSILHPLLPVGQPRMEKNRQRPDDDAQGTRMKRDDDGDTTATGREDPEEDKQLREDEESKEVEFEERKGSQQDPSPGDDSKIEQESDSDAEAGVSEEALKQPVLTEDASVINAVLLAIGKIGAAKSIPFVMRTLDGSSDFAVQSTSVHALGLIGTPEVRDPLSEISRTHPNELIRDQAKRTLERLSGRNRKK